MYPSIKGFRHLYATKLVTWYQLVTCYIIHHRTKLCRKEINEIPPQIWTQTNREH